VWVGRLRWGFWVRCRVSDVASRGVRQVALAGYGVGWLVVGLEVVGMCGGFGRRLGC
jgi:hypothetical protein